MENLEVYVDLYSREDDVEAGYSVNEENIFVQFYSRNCFYGNLPFIEERGTGMDVSS